MLSRKLCSSFVYLFVLMWMNCWLCQGYRTGHIYRDAATGQRYGRASSEADIATKKLSLANDTAAMSYVLFLSFMFMHRVYVADV